MAELAVEALRKRGAEKILVINRTIETGSGTRRRWGAEATTFENFLPLVSGYSDLLHGCTTYAPSAEMVEETMQRRPEHPLVLIDIAVPRDIEPMPRNSPRLRL